jgi:ABC-2 type transport system permease protein
MTAAGAPLDPELPTPRRAGTAANVALVARREYSERVRSRLFALSTLMLVALAVSVALLPVVFRLVDRGTVTRVAVVAAEPDLADSAVRVMDGVLNGGFSAPTGEPRRYEFERRDDATAAIAAVEDGTLAGAVLISRDAAGGLSFETRTGEGLGADRAQLIAVGSFAVAVLDWTASQPAGGTQFRIPIIPPPIAAGGPTSGGEPLSGSEYASRRIVGIVFVVLAFITLVIYGMWVAAGVVAEKSSRVMELLISAATAPQLVTGKIAGIGLAGLTQLVIVLVPALLTLVLSDQIATLLLGDPGSASFSPTGLSPGLLAGFVVYFVLGFWLYAAIYAGAGSLVSRPEDLQVIALPLSLIAIAGYMQAVMALSGGVAGFIRVASFVPFWSPFVMVTRLSISRVEPWELALSVGLLVLTAPLVTWLAIRVYRAGVLLYGQRPGWRMFLVALRDGG